MCIGATLPSSWRSTRSATSRSATLADARSTLPAPSDRTSKRGTAIEKEKELEKVAGKGGGDVRTVGKGREYQGACYTCDKVGHKAWECRARTVNAVQKESDEGEMEEKAVDVGTIWEVEHGVDCRCNGH